MIFHVKVMGESDSSDVVVDQPLTSSSTFPDGQKKYRTYLGRFYVLIVLSLLAIQQNIAWMTFGTIPYESYEQFRLSDQEITLLAGEFLSTHLTLGV